MASIKERLHRRKIVNWCIERDRAWDLLMWGNKPKHNRYFWTTSIEDNTPEWDDEDQEWMKTDWWKIRRSSDEYGRNVLLFPIFWRKDMAVVYGQCWCRDFLEDWGDVDVMGVGCPMIDTTLRWVMDRERQPLRHMVEEYEFGLADCDCDGSHSNG